MDKNLIIVILGLPCMASISIALRILMGRAKGDLNEKVIARISLYSMIGCCALVLYLLVNSIFNAPPGYVKIVTWFQSGVYQANISFLLDYFSLMLMVVIAVISTITLKFSINYLHREQGFAHYFMIMNLFIVAMLLIVMAGNAVLTFVGWELAGVCSYLLISYAKQRTTATSNATRVIITNRIGDIAFLVAIFLSFSIVANVEWHSLVQFQSTSNHLGMSGIALCFTIAAMVKSAQIPFTPWIERALEGPTPSSAIFYGSLMVHAGVYLLIRLEPLLMNSDIVMVLIIIVGVLTALYGWLVGLTQSDIKSSLIFATVTQVGLMFLWIGLGWFELAKVHLIAHAVWRAFQFLNAPALIQLVANNVNQAPSWLIRHRWLYSALMRRFWLEQFGEVMVSKPTLKLAHDARVFDSRVVTPLVGMPAQARAISSLSQWENTETGSSKSKQHTVVGTGEGIFGKLLENVASGLHWFEERLVLKGGGENLIILLRKLGRFFTKIDLLFSQPRYLILMIVITLVIIL